eukprot:gene2340-2888_t
MGDQLQSSFVPEWLSRSKDTPKSIGLTQDRENEDTNNNKVKKSPLVDISSTQKERSSISPSFTSEKSHVIVSSPILPTTFNNNNILNNNNVNNNNNVSRYQYHSQQQQQQSSLPQQSSSQQPSQPQQQQQQQPKYKSKPLLVSFKSQPNLNSFDQSIPLDNNNILQQQQQHNNTTSSSSEEQPDFKDPLSDLSNQFPPLNSTFLPKSPKNTFQSGRSTSPTINLYNISNSNSIPIPNINSSQSTSLNITNQSNSNNGLLSPHSPTTTPLPPVHSGPTLAALITPTPQPSTTTSTEDNSSKLEKVKVLVPVNMSASKNRNSPTPSPMTGSGNSSSLLANVNNLKKITNSQLIQQKSSLKSSMPAQNNPKLAFRKTFSEPVLPGIPSSNPANKEDQILPSRKGFTDPTRKAKVPNPDKILGKEKKNSFFESIIKREKMQSEGLSIEEIEKKEKSLSTTSTTTDVENQSSSPSLAVNGKEILVSKEQTTCISISEKEEIISTSTTTTTTNEINLDNCTTIQQQQQQQSIVSISSTKNEQGVVTTSSTTITTPQCNNNSDNEMINTNTKNNHSELLSSPKEIDPMLKQQQHLPQPQQSYSPVTSFSATSFQEETEEDEEDEEHVEERFLRGLGWVPAEEDTVSDSEIAEISLKMKRIIVNNNNNNNQTTTTTI